MQKLYLAKFDVIFAACRLKPLSEARCVERGFDTLVRCVRITVILTYIRYSFNIFVIQNGTVFQHEPYDDTAINRLDNSATS
jgi:hypothetical protein